MRISALAVVVLLPAGFAQADDGQLALFGGAPQHEDVLAFDAHDGAHWAEGALGSDGALDHAPWPTAMFDPQARGWSTEIGFTHDVGWLQVRGAARLTHVDSRFGEGTLAAVSVSIGHEFKLSRWVTAWIRLEASAGQWTGTPPAGALPSGHALMLSIGSTFR